MGLPSFDTLHVVSDLHLGGAPGFQIFNQGPALAWLVRHIAAGTRGEHEVGLCLNGDIVDFLAAPGAAYLDPVGALDKLEHVFQDDAFRPVWDALADFVRTPRRRLILVLGNHDVELGLPHVRERVLERLAGDDDAARGRVTLALDGSGFACRVGRSEVLCLHGNEVDTWNVVDFGALRHVAEALARRLPSPTWTPNAGTKLVIDVMNDVKRKYAWVDLLKPETSTVPALIVAVDPGSARKVGAFAPIGLRLAQDALRRRVGFLGVEPALAEAPRDDATALDMLLADAYGGAASGAALDSRKLTQALQNDLERDPLELLERGAAGPEMLGMGGAILDLMRGRDPAENVRDALRHWLGRDTTFDWRAPDAPFEDVDALVGPEVDFVVAGHTHLQRALRRSKGSGCYFNSGTWIRLIELRPDVLRDQASFTPVWSALQDGSMETLDARGLVRHVRTVVTLNAEAGGTSGCLQTVEPEAQSWRLQPIDGSRFQGR